MHPVGFQGVRCQRRVDGFGYVHQPADPAGEGPLTGAEFPAKTQHENYSTTATGKIREKCLIQFYVFIFKS